MKSLNQRNPLVNPSNFAMVPRSDVPRSTFKTTHTVKQTFDTQYLVPIHVDEVLPGDVHRGEVTIFARVNNLLFPLMDTLTVETFFFFVPCRILWTNWVKFMGEQANPADSIAYTIPQVVSNVSGMPICSLYDYFGIPVQGQINGAAQLSTNVLPLRAYNRIYKRMVPRRESSKLCRQQRRGWPRSPRRLRAAQASQAARLFHQLPPVATKGH